MAHNNSICARAVFFSGSRLYYVAYTADTIFRMLSHKDTKYLFYKSWPNPDDKGLDDWLDVLENFICAALNVNRVPVIPTSLSNKNNKSKNSSSFRLEDYLNLTKTKIYKVEKNGTIKRQAFPLNWISEADAELQLSGQTSIPFIDIDQLYRGNNEKHKALSLTNNKKNHTLSRPHYYVKTIPSEKVNRLTDTVLKHFKTNRQSLFDTQNLLYKSHKTDYLHWSHNLVPYACLNLHSRQFSTYANRPKKILSIVDNIFDHAIYLNESFRNIYLISKNRDLRFPQLYQCGRHELKIYTYHDFPELSSLALDDYLLYSIEKDLFDCAVVKIYLPGANRLFYMTVSQPSRYWNLYQLRRKLMPYFFD